MSSHLKRSAAASALSLTLVFVPLSALPVGAQEAIEADTSSKTVTLLNINDFHGRISMDIGMGLAGTIQSERAKNPNNTVLLSAGDNVAASLFVSTVQKDKPTVEYLNALKLAASAVGNHEFDYGLADLKNRLEPLADFPYLGANVVDKQTGQPALTPYTIVTTEDGVKVGVIGTVTTQTPELTDPSSLASVTFIDPVEATNKYAAQLSDGNEANGEADIIVAEFHEGVDYENPANDPIVTKTDANVDVIFTGHTHDQYVLSAPLPGDASKTRPVLQTGNYGDNLGKVELSLAEDGSVTTKSAELVKRGAVPSAEAVAADPVLSSVQKILADANAYAQQEGSKTVTNLTAPITTGWDKNQAANRGGFDQRDRESTMAHLVADMYWMAARSTGRTPADFALVNPGGLRDEFPHGLRSSLQTTSNKVTVADVVSVAPFANNIWTTKLTGAQIKQVLEEQWQADSSGKMASRPYLQLGLSRNVTYTYTGTTDAAGFAERGNHIKEVFVNGTKISDTDVFTVALPSFLLNGGDNFRTLAQGTDTKDTALVDSEAFINYLRGMTAVAPRYDKQAVHIENLADSYDLSGNLTFDLSNLHVSSFEVPETTQLTAYIEGHPRPLGVVPVKDGRASVDLPLTNLSLPVGEHTVTLLAPDNIGTSVYVTIRVTDNKSQFFKDVPPGSPFSNEINWLARAGIATGWEDGTFRPAESISRAAVAAFFYRAAGSPDVVLPASPSFSDVPSNHPFYREIEWMKSTGITTGWEDGTFRPAEPISRAAIAAFFYRAAGSPDVVLPASPSFSDTGASAMFYREIEWMAQNKITTGWEDGTYRPADSVSRAAVAAFIHRYQNFPSIQKDWDPIF